MTASNPRDPSVTMTIRLPQSVKEALTETAWSLRMTPNKYAALLLKQSTASETARASQDDRKVASKPLSVEHPKELRIQARDEFGNPDPMPEGRAGLVRKPDEMPPDMPDPVHRQVRSAGVRLPKPDVQPIFRGKDKL